MCSKLDKFFFKKLKLKITGYKAGSFYIVENKEIIFKYNMDDQKHQQLFKSIRWRQITAFNNFRF